MRMATRISAHRRDDGSICAEYEPADRMTMADLEKCVEDMLDAVDDDGNIEYEAVQISPESVVVEKIGRIIVFEFLLEPKKYLRKLPAHGPTADEARELKKMERSMRG